MSGLSKSFSLLIILILAASSLILVKPAFAQSIPKPSVPEFTIRFVNASYTVTTTNSYNGQTTTQQISNNSIEVIVKNQPFSYANNSYQVYFNLRVKPHFENGWFEEVYPLINGTSSPADANGLFSFAWFLSAGSPNQSSTEQTFITLPLLKVALGYDLGYYYESHTNTLLHGIPTNGQIDVQVEALVGHNSEMWIPPSEPQHFLLPTPISGYVPALAYDSTSGWSNTQTISLAPTPTPTTITGNNASSIVAILIVAVITIGAGLLVYFKKRKRQTI
jgi:hypothetical protein